MDIISKLDNNKKCDIQKQRFYEIMIKRKNSLKKDSYFIFQEIILPFQFKERIINCFNKVEKIKENKENKINKEVILENKLIMFLFGISDLNEKHYSEKKNKLFTEFLIETLELIKKGKIVNLGLVVDVGIDWYGNSILSLINEIDEDFKKNNFKKLFDNIQSDLTQSINEIDKRSNILFDLYLNNELLKEKDIEELYKHIEFDRNNKIFTYLENEGKNIFSCYTINDKIINYVKENKLMDECINILINGKEKENNENMDLEILNFPGLFSENNKNDLITQINNCINLRGYFENENIKKEIIDKIKDDENIYKKIYEYVLIKCLKRFSNLFQYQDEIFFENCLKYYWIKPHNLFNKPINYLNKFYPLIYKYLLYFEVEEEPHKKMKYLEMIYDIIKNIYELYSESSFNNYYIYILIWEYYIILINPKRFYSSILKIHLLIRKDSLTTKQVIILFQLKEVINHILNEKINIIEDNITNQN